MEKQKNFSEEEVLRNSVSWTTCRIGVIAGITFSAIMFIGCLAVYVFVAESVFLANSVSDADKINVNIFLGIFLALTILFGIGMILSIMLIVWKNFPTKVYIIFGAIILIPNIFGGIPILVGSVLEYKKEKSLT